MNRIARSILLGVLISLVFVAPALAQYFAYLVVEESNGVSYNNLPLTCFRNITQLVDYDIITSSGLDTRVLTGDVETLPHMLAEDRIMFVTDLEADEEKTLIFYTGAVSLSDFPIIVGYNGSIITPDDPDLELTYVMELLASGYFDASSGSNKNILYKEDAFKMSISATNTLRVAALEAGDVEQWEMHYSPFTSGGHTIYVMANGLAAYLYVDDFEIAKDTANLFDGTSQTINGDDDPELHTNTRRTFYAEDMYWAFWIESSSDDNIHYRTSSDGDSWNSEQTFAVYNSADLIEGFSVWFDGTYCHIAYGDYDSGSENFRYRRGTPESDGSITWSAVWQTASGGSDTYIRDAMVVADSSHYPMIAYYNADIGNDNLKIVKSSTNDGTWSTASGYPLDYSTYNSMGLAVVSGGDKMYLLSKTEVDDDTIYGKYYNGSTWAGTWETVVPSTGGGICPYCASVVADDDENFYIAWTEGHTGPYYTVHLRIRYSGGSFSNIIDLAGGVGDSATWVTTSYNEDADVVYIFYGRNDYMRAMAIQGTEVSGEYTFFGHDETRIMTSTPYSNHIGVLTTEASSLVHGALDFTEYQWNDNSNNWTWMQNNVMPYADYFVMAIDGTTHLQYQPDTIIEGDTLPDVSGASGNDGIINWGANPSGVNTTLYVLHPETGEETIPPVVLPGEASSSDVVGPTGQQGWTSGLPVLASNPLYPLIYVIATETKIPLGIVWILCATFLLILAMFLCVRYVPHLIFTALVGGGLSAFFYAIGIYPFWVIFIFAVMALAIIIGERSPTV